MKQKRGLGSNLAGLRDGEGLTQKELAEAIGTAQPRVAEWEKGEGKPDPKLSTLLRLAVVLRCSVEDLVVGVNEEYDQKRGTSPDMAPSDTSARPKGAEEGASMSSPLDPVSRAHVALLAWCNEHLSESEAHALSDELPTLIARWRRLREGRREGTTGKSP